MIAAILPEGAKAAAIAPAKSPVFFALTKARAAEVLKTLQPILEGQNVTVGVDERTNSLIVIGSPEVLEIIRNLVARLDEA